MHFSIVSNIQALKDVDAVCVFVVDGCGLLHMFCDNIKVFWFCFFCVTVPVIEKTEDKVLVCLCPCGENIVKLLNAVLVRAESLKFRRLI